MFVPAPGAAHELVDGVAGVGAGPDDGGGFQEFGGAGADGDAPCPNPPCAPKPGGVEGWGGAPKPEVGEVVGAALPKPFAF